MKIFRIIARLNVGGPARHVVWLTDKLKSRGFQSVLIAGTVPEGEEDMGYFATQNGVLPIYLSQLSRELSPNDLISLFKIYREIRRQRPDIIHTHTAKAGTVGRVAAFFYKWLTPGSLIGRPRKVKVVHTFHGHVFHSYYGKAKTRIFILIEQALARFATDRIVVITDQQFSEIHEKYGVGRREQFSIIPLGVDLTQFTDGDAKRDLLRQEIGALPEETIVGFTGRLTEIKNIPLLLNVAALCNRIHSGPKLRFAIIGDGGLRPELERMAADLDLGKSVIFLGNRHDVADLLPGMDIIALTSRNEGTPLSLIEAMGAGTPLISTAVGGVVDLVGGILETRDGFRVAERGVLVGSDDPQGFVNGLLYLAQKEEMRKRLGKSAQGFVSAVYSVERLAHDIATLYHDLVPNEAPAE